jgi:hypothetical protein
METDAVDVPIVPSKRKTAFWNDEDDDENDNKVTTPSTSMRQPPSDPPSPLAQKANELESMAVDKEEEDVEDLIKLERTEPPKFLLKPSRESEYRYLGGQRRNLALILRVATFFGALTRIEK